MPRPWLGCASDFRPQVAQFGKNEEGTLHFDVWNAGNAPAWTCYVELYEGPFGKHNPLSKYELRGQEIIALQPGELRTVHLAWVRRRALFSRIVGIVHDPIRDPKDFTLVEEANRHVTADHWTSLVPA